MASNFDAPIPGENFTSDTKNYPWHRPPEHTDLDSAIEEIFKKITSDEVSVGLLTMIEMGQDLTTIADMIVTAGIGAGKWTPDFALLMGGPIVHILYLMAKGYGLDCELGYETDDRPPTIAFFKGIKKIEESRAEDAVDSIDIESVKEAASQAKPAGGFMGGAPGNVTADLENEASLGEEEPA